VRTASTTGWCPRPEGARTCATRASRERPAQALWTLTWCRPAEFPLGGRHHRRMARRAARVFVQCPSCIHSEEEEP
jgi:hypothetical protein